MSVFRVYWRAVKHLNLRGYVYIWANLLWVLLSLPVITAPAAWSGLVHLTYQSHISPTTNVSAFWDGFKQHFWHSLGIGLVTAVVVVINLSNVWAYPYDGSLERVILQVIWTAAIVLWSGLLLYAFPLLTLMESPTFWNVFKNAALMLVKHPLFTLGILSGVVVVMIISTAFFPAWFLLTGSSIAALAMSATLSRLEIEGLNPAQPDNPL